MTYPRYYRLRPESGRRQEYAVLAPLEVYVRGDLFGPNWTRSVLTEAELLTSPAAKTLPPVRFTPEPGEEL